MENSTDDPEVIRQRMQENRTALTEKLEALEQQVLGVATSVTDTVESVKEGVQDTVEAVKDTVESVKEGVKETVEDTVETVKESFNLWGQFERHPWAMLGGSLGVGLLLGVLLRRRRAEPLREADEGAARRFGGGNGARKESEGGMADGLLAPVKEGLTRVKDLALGTLFATVQKVLVRELPEVVESQVKSFLDDAVEKLKGAVKHEKPAEAPSPPPQGRRKGDRQETAFHPETGRPMGQGSW